MRTTIKYLFIGFFGLFAFIEFMEFIAFIAFVELLPYVVYSIIVPMSPNVDAFTVSYLFDNNKENTFLG